MLEIAGGSFELLKKEMKQASQGKKDEVKAIKKKMKDIKPGVKTKLDMQREIEGIECYTKTMFAPSKVLPVRVGSIVLNYKAYCAFAKKIEGLRKTESLTDDLLKIEYKTGEHSRGYVEFTDLSSYFEGFQHIPRAVLKNGQEE
ncbi:hypothetical protein ACOSZF_21690 [Cytobacillus firmus]|uniref:hypothetical protein n=1 Tax=Cytobacillus firmus TaxID=1399 RepID=UPI003BA1A811